MNHQSKIGLRFFFPSIPLKVSGILITIIFAGVFQHSAKAQNVDTRPVARLITATSAAVRPRRVTPVANLASETDPEPYPSLEEVNSVERRAFEQTNLERVKNGLLPFVWDPALCRMARNHSENMARQGFFSHVTPAGDRLRDRARLVGIVHYALIAENIAYNLGYDDPGAFAVERWMISPGHRKNILFTGFKAMAVGSAIGPDGAVFITQTFITR